MSDATIHELGTVRNLGLVMGRMRSYDLHTLHNAHVKFVSNRCTAILSGSLVSVGGWLNPTLSHPARLMMSFLGKGMHKNDFCASNEACARRFENFVLWRHVLWAALGSDWRLYMSITTQNSASNGCRSTKYKSEGCRWYDKHAPTVKVHSAHIMTSQIKSAISD